MWGTLSSTRFKAVMAALIGGSLLLLPHPAQAAQTYRGLVATKIGTVKRDTIKGTPGDDVILGRDGADVIDGRGQRHDLRRQGLRCSQWA